MEAPWTKSPEEILQHFGVDPSRGLTSAQAAKHAELYGKNGTNAISCFNGAIAHSHTLLELPEDPPTPLWELILEQFKDQLVLILLGSAVVSFVLAVFEDTEGGFFRHRVRRAARHISHSSRQCDCWRYPGDECRKSDRCTFRFNRLFGYC